MSTKKVWLVYNTETDNAVKGLVENWTWDDMNLIHTHFAIKGALNTIRANLEDLNFDHDTWTVIGFAKFVFDSYEEILYHDNVNQDRTGFEKLAYVVLESYILELHDINRYTRSLNQKGQNWSYLTKVTS
jgi:hypothetical protein